MKRLLFILLLIVVAFPSCVFESDDENLFEIVGDKKALVFGENGGSNSVVLKSGTKWQITKKPEWISIDSVAPGNNPFEWIVRFKCEENRGGFRRESVTFSTAFTEIDFDITQHAVKTISVNTVEVYPTELNLELNSSAELKVTVKPSDATNKDVTWTSSDPEAVSVDNNGKVTALSAGGPVSITVTSVDGGKKAVCTVSVIVPVSSISMTKEETIVAEDSKTLVATVLPSNATDPSISWSSSSPEVATVDESGIVKAIKVGTTTITATSKSYPEVNAQCVVTVTAKHIPVQSISLSPASLNMKAGEETSVALSVKPSDASDKRVHCSAPSDDGIAKIVDNSDGTYSVRALMKGETSFTFTSVENPQATAVLTVKVEFENKAPVAVDLGLSVKWASFNLGATTPEGAGYYYSWGEVEPKSEYDWNYYLWSGNGATSLTKYNTDKSYGEVDNKTVLDPKNDAANVNLGSTWRMPTDAEWAELVNTNNCTWIWRSNYNSTGAAGYEVTSKKTNKSIFLPAAGRYSGKSLTDKAEGYYWSVSLNTDSPCDAYSVRFSSGSNSRGSYNRYYGHSIRPVYKNWYPVTSISLDKTSVSLHPDETYQLKAEVSPSNATVNDIRWVSNKNSVATVNENGLVTAVDVGTATITAYGSSGVSASCTVTVTPAPKLEPVDLGLKVKWAPWNVGASSPEEYGDYYAWGEIEKETNYSWSTYKWGKSSYNLTKYNIGSNYGKVDNKTVLDPEDDIAQVHADWGSEWRMPTDADWKELIANCSWRWVSNYEARGVAGYIVTSKMPGYTDNSIFLPAAGRRNDTSLTNKTYGYYWSSSLNADAPYKAYSVSFYSSSHFWGNYDRYYGHSVRPVYGELIPVESISLNKSFLELHPDKTYQLTAEVSPSSATVKDIRWVSSDKSVATVDADGLVKAVGVGKATITAYGSSGVSASCTVTVTSAPKLEPVDLGLSVKWAPWNVGASSPEEYGDYYAWGETKSKEDYSWSTYTWGKSSNSLTKYNISSSYGKVDNKTVLDAMDDAASVNLPDSWRMPTDAEWTELVNANNCTWTWISNFNSTGVAGYKVTSKKTNKSIFLPAAGYQNGWKLTSEGENGYYWSSDLSTGDSCDALWRRFSYSYSGQGSNNTFRYLGLSVRPVYGEQIPVKSITLDRFSLKLHPDKSYQLTATVSPSNATSNAIRWVSSNKSVATVDAKGLVKAVEVGSATITAYGSSGVSASCTVTVTSAPKLEPVDLGLSVKWAPWNVGASYPEEYGDYFAWGETKSKSDYSWSAYAWGNNSNSLTKYNTSSGLQVDNKTVLDPVDDAARVNWGNEWRMPTDAEWKELIDQCFWKWTSNYDGTGVAGYIVTSKRAGYTNKSIFLPAVGRYDNGLPNVGTYGYYWSSSLYPNLSSYASIVDFSSNTHITSGSSRCYGLSVRPVYGKLIPVESIDLDKSSMTLSPNETYQLKATVNPSSATVKDIRWESNKNSVATVSENGLVKAVGAGSATITAFGSSGVSASCTVTVASGYPLFLGQWKTSNNTIWTISEDVREASYNISGLYHGTTPVVIKASYDQSKTCLTVYAQDNLGRENIFDEDTGTTYENCPIQLLGWVVHEGKEYFINIGESAYCVFSATLDSTEALLLSPPTISIRFETDSANCTLTSCSVLRRGPNFVRWYTADKYELPQKLVRISSSATSNDSPGKVPQNVVPTSMKENAQSQFYCRRVEAVQNGATNGRVRNY